MWSFSVICYHFPLFSVIFCRFPSFAIFFRHFLSFSVDFAEISVIFCLTNSDHCDYWWWWLLLWRCLCFNWCLSYCIRKGWICISESWQLVNFLKWSKFVSNRQSNRFWAFGTIYGLFGPIWTNLEKNTDCYLANSLWGEKKIGTLTSMQCLATVGKK